LNAHLLIQIGQLLYGPYWKKSLGKEMRITDRQLSRWTNEGFAIPDTLRDGRNIRALLLNILEAHHAKTGQLISQVKALRNHSLEHSNS
jgi:hypothetical protein